MGMFSFVSASKKGSVLAMSIVIIFLILISAISILSSAVLQQRSSLSTGNSVKAFQNADSAVEMILYQLYRNREYEWTLGTFADSLGASCDEGGIVSTDGWRARFYMLEDPETPVEVPIESCDASYPAGGFRRVVTKVRVEGRSTGTTRFVETSVMSQAQYCLTNPTVCQSCTFENYDATPQPMTVESGASVRAFFSGTVPYGSICTSETRTCEDGYLTGSYRYGRCDVSTTP